MDGELVRLLILVLVFGAVLLGVEALLRWMRASQSRGRAINARLALISRGVDRDAIVAKLRRSKHSNFEALPLPLARLAGSLERLLTASGIRLEIGKMLMLLAAGASVTFLLCVLGAALAGATIGAGTLLLLGTFGAAVGVGLPLMLISRAANKRRKKMVEQFPVALDVFIRGLRAGHPIAAALDLLTVEMPDPIGSEFGLVIDEVTYGADLKDALQSMADRWGLEDMHMFVVSLSVQNETGGNLAEILQGLASVIRERASMYLKVRALSSEGRMTGLILTALPILAFSVLFLINPRFYLDVSGDPLFVRSFVGLIGLYAIGFFWIRKMIDIKV
jgi:tight adherence protein B